jgi:hypothetical protein
MIGRMIRACGADDVAGGRTKFRKLRFQMIADSDIGGAPSYFTKEQDDIWEELKLQIPVGLARSADRIMVEVTVHLVNKLRTKGLSGSETSQLINALGRLGCSPADRSKCAVAPEVKGDSNEFAGFV